MPADARITYRKRNPYNTRSNYFKKVRTPGSRIVVHYLKKLHLKHRSVPKCGDTGKPLRGVLPNRGNYKNRRLTKSEIQRKAVSRPYGGCLSHIALRNRILRAFLTEEARIVRKVQRARREKRLQGKARPKKKKVVPKKKKAAKPITKKAAPAATEEPRKPSKYEEKVARREVRREKRKVKQAKKQAAEEESKKAPPKTEPTDDSGKGKKKKGKGTTTEAKQDTGAGKKKKGGKGNEAGDSGQKKKRPRKKGGGNQQ